MARASYARPAIPGGHRVSLQCLLIEIDAEPRLIRHSDAAVDHINHAERTTIIDMQMHGEGNLEFIPQTPIVTPCSLGRQRR